MITTQNYESYYVNKPLSVSFLSLFCVLTTQAIFIQEEIKHCCGRRLTEQRVYSMIISVNM
jgi:hypothetical protein